MRVPQSVRFPGQEIGGSRVDEEQVGEPVEIGQRPVADRLLPRQRDQNSLRSPADRAGDMQLRGGGTPTREDEVVERRQPRVPSVDLLLDPQITDIPALRAFFSDWTAELRAG